jgi:uncharacterized protein YeaO (DUF488 family)
MLTGYFAKLKTYTDNGLIPVSIALYSPKWYSGLEYKKLAPSPGILHDFKVGEFQGVIEHYRERYVREILGVLNPKVITEELEKLTKADSDKIILLCYERPEDFCHRHLVADWIMEYRETERDSYIGYITEFTTDGQAYLPNLGIFY